MDDIAANSSSSSSSSDEGGAGGAGGSGDGTMQIDVQISDKKNDIIEVPPIVHEEHKDELLMPLKADNDMESSDLSFSEDKNNVDEHEYQIGELGNFEVEKSISDDVIGINKDESVDFSEGDLSAEMMSELSKKAAHDTKENMYSDLSEISSSRNEIVYDMDLNDDYYSSEPDVEPVWNDDEWDRFLTEELYNKLPSKEEPMVNQEAPAPPAPAPAPPSPPAPAPAKSSSVSSSSVSSSESSSVSSLSSSSSSSSSTAAAPAANRRNRIDSEHLVPKEPKKPVQPANVWKIIDD